MHPQMPLSLIRWKFIQDKIQDEFKEKQGKEGNEDCDFCQRVNNQAKDPYLKKLPSRIFPSSFLFSEKNISSSL